MRRAISIFLIHCFVIPVTGIFLHFHINQRHIRKEVKHRMLSGMDRNELERLAFHKADTASLTWKHNREFVFQGQFYDIVQSETHGDSIIYFCWWDNDETQLHHKLDALIANFMQRDPLQQQQQNRITDFFKTCYCNKLYIWHDVSVMSQQTTLVDKTLPISLLSDSPPAPPPKLV